MHHHDLDGLPSWMLWGSELGAPDTSMVQAFHATEVSELLSMLHAVGSSIDVAELCGGAARATKLAVRRKLRTGQNFDLITNVDLNNPRDKAETKKYVQENHVLVMVMAPTCGPF